MEFTVLDNASFLSVREGLQRVCRNAVLPVSAREQAAQIMMRFDTGVRVFVLGPQTAGKSTLCNGLVAIPERERGVGTTRVFHTSEQIIVPDGSVLQSVQTHHRRIDANAIGPVSLIDMQVPSHLPTAAQLYSRIFQEADVVIWCTREFAPDEADIWERAPETLKDHSFLVLANADAASQHVSRRDRMTELQSRVVDEFHSMFFIDTYETASRAAVVRTGAEHGTGVSALRSTLKRLVISGRDADIDGAMLFLDRYGSDAPAEATSEGVENDGKQTQRPDNPALSFLKSRAFDLAEMAFDEATGDMSDVLNYCAETAEELTTLVGQGKVGNCAAKKWEVAFEDAADKIVLLAAENNTRSAADAVTILLQMRRDLASFPDANAFA